jgi:hypothetical protein
MDKVKREGWPDSVIMSETHMMTILIEQLGLTEAEAMEWMSAAAEIAEELEKD